MSKNQEGFSALEVILLLVIVAFVAGIGVYVYKQRSATTTSKSSGTNSTQFSSTPQTNPTKSANTVTYTDPAKTFTVELPKSWKNSDGPLPSAASFAPFVDDKMLYFIPDNSPLIAKDDPSKTQNSIGVLVYKSGDTGDLDGLDNVESVPNIQQQHKALTVNGYKAKYQQTVTTDDLAYTEDLYSVTNGTTTVVFQFREKMDKNFSNSLAFDDTQNVNNFTAVVKSIKFL